MTNRPLRFFSFLLLVSACSSTDSTECGADGSHSQTTADGGCACESGYTWEDVSSPDNNACVPCDVAGCVREEQPVGGACLYDDECETGTCFRRSLGGVTFPDGYCTQFGCSSTSCPDDSVCVDAGESLCVQLCEREADCRLGYTCTPIDNETSVCWLADEPEDCPTSCPGGTRCAHTGACVDIAPSQVPSGSIPNCDDVPTWECDGNEAYCGELVAFSPLEGPGYWKFPDRGETFDNMYRSYARRDLMMLVKYAAAMTACLSEDWEFGNGGPLGLGDMSEEDGATPGTSDGEPGHPELTHVDGHDMDIGYYQVGTDNNLLRPVCPHWASNEDQAHCTGTPDLLDPWRTALFIGLLHASPQVWNIGVDGKIGPGIEQKLEDLCDAGWLDTSACTNEVVEYETNGNVVGWYYYHHDHLHIALESQSGYHPEKMGY